MEFSIILLNFAYAAGGVVITLLSMVAGFYLFDRVTPFDTAAELRNNNLAVGVVVGSIFMGLGIAVGLVVGLGLN